MPPFRLPCQVTPGGGFALPGLQIQQYQQFNAEMPTG
jgi:hypothetical protein